jgi:Zn-dependent protease with chaperone function
MNSTAEDFEPYHTHLGYTLTITMLAWAITLWYSRRYLRDRPDQRVILYGLVIGLPLCGEAGSYVLSTLRPGLDTVSGSLISRVHGTVLHWLPLDDLLDLFLSPRISLVVLAFLALLGLGSIVRGCYGALRLHRSFERARPLAQTTFASIEARLRETTGTSSQPLPPILVIEQSEPIACTTGVLRPRIYVTTLLLDLLAPDELVAVLCHEWAHIQRGDLPWNWLVRLFRDTLCFLPSSHLFWSSMIVSQDEACDALAAEMTREPLALARALVKVARAWQESSKVAMPAANLFASPSVSLRMRIEQMLRLSEHGQSTPTLGAHLLAIALLLLAMLPVMLGC